MVAEIRSDGTCSRSTAGEIHPALPKLRDQLQRRGRHGAPLHRKTKRRRSRETLERICQTAVLATITQRVNRLIRKPGKTGKQENRKTGEENILRSCFPNSNLLVSWFPDSIFFECIQRRFRFWAN